MPLPYLSDELLFDFCWVWGLRDVAVARLNAQGECLTTQLNKQLSDVLLIHLCPNFWMSGCKIGLKGSLGIVFLIEN